MTRDRLIQLIAAAVCLVGATGAGALLPSLLEDQERYALRYTDDVAEGAPPFVAFATSIGALRGVLVNYLWIKINTMKEKGQFYEVMADADLLTKLQPRFPTVWTFHGHNMAYNISVATHTPEERWEWVRSGIRLVQKEGLKYNPNDLLLHRELAFWYAHKIDGYADDAHLHYKREFCREWHYVLGPPPPNYEDRIAWIKAVADAPESLQEAEERSPGVLALVERLKSDLNPFQRRTEFELDARFLRDYGQWKAITEQSMVAELLGYAERARRDNEFFRAFDELAADPARAEAWQTLLQHVRKKVLREEYNMDPQRMYEYTRDLGPIDWRHAQGHALYWARRGAEVAESRVANEDDVYKIVNNDRMQLQAMQALAREGRIRFDPFSEELPNRYMEPRWIDTIDQQFEHFWKKHEHTRGAGGSSASRRAVRTTSTTARSTSSSASSSRVSSRTSRTSPRTRSTPRCAMAFASVSAGGTRPATGMPLSTPSGSATTSARARSTGTRTSSASRASLPMSATSSTTTKRSSTSSSPTARWTSSSG